MNLFLKALLIKSFKTFNKALIKLIESSKVETRRSLISKLKAFLYKYLLSYLILYLLYLIINKSNKRLYLNLSLKLIVKLITPF